MGTMDMEMEEGMEGGAGVSVSGGSFVLSWLGVRLFIPSGDDDDGTYTSLHTSYVVYVCTVYTYVSRLYILVHDQVYRR